MNALQVVTFLNRIFTAFDRILEELGIEKIKTIGDAYMAVSGAPVARADHVDVMLTFALKMLCELDKFNAEQGPDEPQFGLRVGVNCGTIVAGVVGTSKFLYDVWGGTFIVVSLSCRTVLLTIPFSGACNLASRMESTGVDRRVQVSSHVYEKAKGNPAFRFVERGEVFCKGIGNVRTYFVEDSSTPLSQTLS